MMSPDPHDGPLERRWLIRRLSQIESMGPHAPRALREFIDELGDYDGPEPEWIAEVPRRRRRLFHRRNGR